MAFISTIPDAEAAGPPADMYEADRAAVGYVQNYTRAFALRPAVFEAWGRLLASIRDGMDLRRYELATFAAAQRLRSSYCSLAHGMVLIDRFLDQETLLRIVADARSAELDPVDLAVVELADRVAADATSVTQADVDRLRGLGLSDADVFDVVAAAAARCFYSKTLDALGVQPDPSYAALDAELRDALTVGRPIAKD
jgi:uncharacterized peroxidase-related enzyme